MQININKQDLLTSLSKVQYVVDKRSTVQSFDHVKIDINASTIHLTTTDADIMMTNSFSAQSDYSLSFTTNAALLYDIVRKIYDTEELTFITEGKGSLLVRSEKSEFTLSCLSPESFPSFDTRVEGYSFHIKVSELKLLLQQTRHAISAGEARYYLLGIYLHLISTKEAQADFEKWNEEDRVKYDSQNSMVMRSVSTDGHRLACTEVPAGKMGISHSTEALDVEKVDSSPFFGLIIPKKTVGEIIRAIEDMEDEDQIKIDTNNSRMALTMGNTKIISKIIDAKFPNYKSAIPSETQYDLVLNTSELRKAIDLVGTISDNKNKEVKFLIQYNKLTVIVTNTELSRSSAKQEIAASFNSKKTIEILLNIRYLQDCLNVIHGRRVKFKITDFEKPIIIQDVDDPRSKYVLMPMRFESNH